MFFGGVTMLACGGWIGYNVWIGYGEIGESLGLQLFLAVVAVAMFGSGIACTLFTIRYRVYLVDDTLRMRHISGYREIRREELRGFRITASTPSTLHLIPKNKSTKKLDVTLCFKDSDGLWMWLDGLPDLNIEDQLDAEDRVLDNPAFGQTEERRWNALVDARRAAKYTNVLIGLAAAWAFFYPEPYEPLMLILIAAPWICAEVVRRYSGLVLVDERPYDIQPSIAASLIGACMMLGARAMLDWQVIAWPKALLWGSLLAGATLVLLLKLDSSARKSRLSVIFLFVFLVSYGYGAIVMVNCLWEGQRIEIIEVEVGDKRVSGSSPASYRLQLAPWGPFDDAKEFEVSRSFHQDVEAGDLVCAAVRQGVLQIPWFTLRRCR